MGNIELEYEGKHTLIDNKSIYTQGIFNRCSLQGDIGDMAFLLGMSTSETSSLDIKNQMFDSYIQLIVRHLKHTDRTVLPVTLIEGS